MEKNNKIELYINEKLKEEQIRVPMLDFEMNEKGDYQYTTKVYEQPNKIGSIVIDFIQKDIKEMSYFIFRFYGFQTLLTEKEKKKILALNPNEKEELDNKMEKLYSKYQKEFENYKRQIIDILEYCLFNDKEELEELNPLEKLHLFINTNKVEEYPILEHNEFKKVIKINKDTSKIKKGN